MKSYRENMRDIKRRRDQSEESDRATSIVHKRNFNRSIQQTAEKSKMNLTLDNINIDSALKAHDVKQQVHSERAQSARDHTVRCRSA